MRRSVAASSLCAVLATCALAADYDVRNPGFRRYSIMRPTRRPDDGYRLLVYLHGGGGGEDQAPRMWGEHAPQRGYVVVGPKSSHGYWMSSGDDLDFVTNVVRAVQREFDVPRRRTLFVGYSAGAAATFFYCLPHPDLAAAFCAINGPVHQKALPYLTRKDKVAILALYGDQEKNRPGVEAGLRFLRKRGYPVRLGVIRKSGHAYAPRRLNPLILEWFEKLIAAEPTTAKPDSDGRSR